jgi:hypothetical protein
MENKPDTPLVVEILKEQPFFQRCESPGTSYSDVSDDVANARTGKASFCLQEDDQ